MESTRSELFSFKVLQETYFFFSIFSFDHSVAMWESTALYVFPSDAHIETFGEERTIG